MSRVRSAILAGSATAAFAATALVAALPQAGGLLLYEFGTAEPGLAAAGYAAGAGRLDGVHEPGRHDELDGTQVLVGGQLMWLNTQFSVDGATSPAWAAATAAAHSARTATFRAAALS